jgi:hypothetical protein
MSGLSFYGHIDGHIENRTAPKGAKEQSDMDNDSPELAAIKLLHRQFQKFAAQSLEQGIQIYSLLHASQDLLMIALKGQGFSQEEIEETVKLRTELVRKHYEENAKALTSLADALAEVDESKPPM